MADPLILPAGLSGLPRDLDLTEDADVAEAVAWVSRQPSPWPPGTVRLCHAATTGTLTPSSRRGLLAACVELAEARIPLDPEVNP